MCLLATVLLLGPRGGVVVWWLLSPDRWSATFESFWWPLLGLVLMPWLTLAYVWVSPGGYSPIDWFAMGAAALADVAGVGAGYRSQSS